ncbi:MAG: hypothetical protein WC229_03445 [Candidatus Paceibacterota bacterium]|jgi:uncharacterized membrane protein
MKTLDVVTRVRIFLRWLIFASLAVLFSLSLAQSFITARMKNKELNHEDVNAAVTLIPLVVVAVALVVIIILISNSRRDKKILKCLDCIDDRGKPDGEL